MKSSGVATPAPRRQVLPQPQDINDLQESVPGVSLPGPLWARLPVSPVSGKGPEAVRRRASGRTPRPPRAGQCVISVLGGEPLTESEAVRDDRPGRVHGGFGERPRGSGRDGRQSLQRCRGRQALASARPRLGRRAQCRREAAMPRRVLRPRSGRPAEMCGSLSRGDSGRSPAHRALRPATDPLPGAAPH